MNPLKKAVMVAAHKLGYELYKTPTGVLRVDRTVEVGQDHFADMKTILRKEARCILDIGANVGQTAALLAANFPQAEIYSFEPHPVTFETMRSNTASIPRVHPVQAAVGATPGQATLFCNTFNQTNSLLPLDARAGEFTAVADHVQPAGTVDVPVVTVDEFCEKNGIQEIDILKSDAEGLDLDVIRGASKMIARGVVPLIYTEVLFVPTFEKQPLFHDVYQYLYDLDYRLVGLYESGHLTHFYHVGGNALFVHASVGRRPERRLSFRFGKYELYR